MQTDLVCETLHSALARRGWPQGAMVHSDRGSQYCSHEYQNLINQHKLLCRMSAKGCCYDNACVENFFHSLKVEAVHGLRVETRENMKETIFEYIEIAYHRQRLHSSIGYRTPWQFEQLFALSRVSMVAG